MANLSDGAMTEQTAEQVASRLSLLGDVLERLAKSIETMAAVDSFVPEWLLGSPSVGKPPEPPESSEKAADDPNKPVFRPAPVLPPQPPKPPEIELDLSQPKFPASPSSETSSVPAFDRPIPVIVVGPKPLPVSFSGGSSGAQPPGIGGRAGAAIGGVTLGLNVANSAIRMLSSSLRTVAATTTAFMDVIDAYVGQVNRVTSMVEAFDPGTAYLFKDAVENLSAAMGRVFVPMIQQATVVINAINAAIGRLTGGSRLAIAAAAGAGAIMATLAATVGMAAGLFLGLAGAISAVAVASSAIPVVGQLGAVLGMLAAPLVAVGIAGTSAGVGLATFMALTSNTQTLLSALMPVLNAIVNGFNKLSPRLMQAAENIAPFLIVLVELGAEFAGIVVDIMSAKGAIEALGLAILVAMAPILFALSPLILLGGAIVLLTTAVWGLLRVVGLVSSASGSPVSAAMGGSGEAGMTVAAKQASFTSAQAMAERTYANAYSLGTSDPMVNLTSSIGALTSSIDNLQRTVEIVIQRIGGGVRSGTEAATNVFRGWANPVDLGMRVARNLGFN